MHNNLTIHDTITVLIDSFHSGYVKKIPRIKIIMSY